MSEQLVADIWSEIKRYVNPHDRAEAADTVLSVMIDHDLDAADIRAAFGSDPDMKEALAAHLDDAEDDDYVEDEDFDDEDQDH
jgi:hypothetical protein